jgi:hypothetical protein
MTARMKRLILASVYAWLFSSGTACACLWDRDTLAMEAEGLPDIINTIAGRFERNPSLFYEMRLQRTAAQLY